MTYSGVKGKKPIDKNPRESKTHRGQMFALINLILNNRLSKAFTNKFTFYKYHSILY